MLCFSKYSICLRQYVFIILFGGSGNILLNLSICQRLGRFATSFSDCVSGELLLEALASEEDTALDGSDRKIELLGDFGILVSGDHHVERNAEVIGERFENGSDLLHGVGTFGSVKTGVLADIEVVEILGAVNNSCLANLLAVVVDEDVAHDGEDPCLEVGVGGELRLVVESLEGGVLKEVFGLLAVRGQLEREVEKIALKVDKFLFEGFLSSHSRKVLVVIFVVCLSE